jgi:trimeric autotransporter adhesin
MTQAMRFNVDASDNASAVFRKVAAAAEKLKETLKDLDKRITPTVRLEGAPGVKRDVAAIRRDMDRIRNVDAKVKVSVAGNAALNNLTQKLDRLSDAHINVHVNITPPGIEARLQALNTLLGRMQGTTTHTIRVNEDGGIGRASGKFGRLLRVLTLGQKGFTGFVTGLMTVGAAAAAATASVGSLTAAAASLGGALVGTVPILVAGAGMIGGVLATLKVGTQGLAFAFEALAEGDMKNWGKAMANLSPEAQKFAGAIKNVWGELRQAKGAIQDNLFQGMGEAVSKLARTELPMLQKGMGGVATELNLAAKSVMDYIGGSEGIARQEVMWANTATVVRNLRPWLTNVTAAMFDIGEVGSSVLADITGGAGEAGLGFRKMIAEARASGELEKSMRAGVETLRQLGSIARNVGSILGSVFTAARTAGADFLATLDRGTEALANFLKSGQGQTALVDFFREARATLDALGTGLAAAGRAAAAFISAFSNTGGLAAVGTALSSIMIAAEPLAATLGRLAGETLGILATAAGAVATALAPIVTVISAVVSAMGPLAPMILASVVTFTALRAAATAAFTGLASAAVAAAAGARGATGAFAGLAAAQSTAAMATHRYLLSMGLAAGASRVAAIAVGVLSTAMRVLTLAIPVIGVALVAATALFGGFGAAAEASAEQVANGSATFQESVQAELDKLRERQTVMASANIEGAEFGSVQDAMATSVDGSTTALTAEEQALRNAEAGWQEYRATLSPMEQLQADVTRAKGELNDIMAAGGAGTAAAAAAAARLTEAERRLAAAEDGAAAAIAKTNQTLADRIGAVQSALGGMLQMEEALARVAEAETAANEAAKEHGAASKEATDANRVFAGAADQAAQAAQKQAAALAESQGATNAADFGARTYASTLAQVAATASGPAKAGLLSYLASLSDADIAAVNAAAAASGFKVQMMALPDGRNIAIAVDPETGEIISTKTLLDTIQDKTITINGTAMPAQQALTSVLSQVAAGAESITINGKAMPAQEALAAVLGMITGSTGTVTINGQAVPAQDVLGALIAAVNSGSGTVSIGGQDVPAQDVLRALIGAIGASSAEVTLDANGQPVTAAKTVAEQPTGSLHTLGDPITDNTVGAKATATGATANPHTVGAPTTDSTGGVKGAAGAPTGNPHTVGEPTTDATGGGKATAAAPTGNPHTVGAPTDVGPVNAGKATASQPSQSLHTINADDKAVVDAKGRAEQPTQSMHTINCNDSAVRSAKTNAQRATSSTHTIHVVVVGGGVPRAFGAVATPRAQGGYATAYANGGMRPMSAARAQIVPPRQPRVIGDRMKGDEAFIPINQAPLSKAILNTTAQRMGYNLVPQNGQAMPASGAAASVSLSSIRSAINQRVAGGGALVSAVQQLSGQLRALRGDVDHHGDNQAIVQELRALRSLLAQGGAGGGSATARASASRTLSELGAF